MSTENPSNTPGKIYLAVIAVIQGIEAIKKERKNEQQGFKFRGIDDVYNSLNPIFAKCGIVCLPAIEKTETTDWLNAKGNKVHRVVATVRYRFMAEDGSMIEAIGIGEGMDFADKATAKALSMAHKYVLLQAFLIPTQDIIDGDADNPISDAAERLREYGEEWKGKSLGELEALRDEYLNAKKDFPQGLLGAIAEAKAAKEEGGEPPAAKKERQPRKSKDAQPAAGDATTTATGSEPAGAGQTAAAPEKAPEKAPEAPKEPVKESPPFLAYVIQFVNHEAYIKKTIKDIAEDSISKTGTISRLEALVKNWIGRYVRKFKEDAGWAVERDMILKAIAHYGSEAGTPENIAVAEKFWADKAAASATPGAK